MPSVLECDMPSEGNWQSVDRCWYKLMMIQLMIHWKNDSRVAAFLSGPVLGSHVSYTRCCK